MTRIAAVIVAAAPRAASGPRWLAITLAADPGISLPTPARHEPLEAQRVVPMPRLSISMRAIPPASPVGYNILRS